MRKRALFALFFLLTIFAFAQYQIGDHVTDFMWVESNGQIQLENSLSNLQSLGKVTVLVFGGSWEPATLVYAPDLEDVWQLYGAENGDVHIHLAVGDIADWSELDGPQFRTSFTPPLTYWLSTEDQVYTNYDAFGDGYIPYTAVIDQNGYLVDTFAGGDIPRLTAAIDSCFGQVVTLHADFTASDTNPITGTEIQFTDTSTGSIINWEWDFEDDGIIDSYEQNPYWTYDEPGIYSVTLTVYEDRASDTSTKTDYMNVRVNIPDENFKMVINEELGQSAEYNPSLEEMESINSIYSYKEEIASIQGAEYLTNVSSFSVRYSEINNISYLANLTNLTSLNLYHNNINDISNLANLTNLNYLDIRSNDVTDVSVLSNLINLTDLDFSSNNVIDISFLSSLTNLTDLDFSSNDVIDISFLSSLTNLTDLDFSSNDVIDISFLSSLTNLTDLDFSSNDVIDISFLSSLTNLTDLDFGYNEVNDISVLSNLTNLSYLYLNGNDVTNISVLSNLTNLNYLSISSNYLTDISVLSSLTNLASLYFGSNDVIDISFLSNLTNLTVLDFGYNEVNDISFLSDLPNLTYLNINSIGINDISILENLNKLNSLNCSYNSLSDISVISNLENLRYLYLDHNNINDISALEDLTSLYYLYLNDNKISDVSSLANLTNLHILDLHNNQISDIYPLVANTGLGTDGDDLFLERNNESNPLSREALEEHIPILLGRDFDDFEYPQNVTIEAPCFPFPQRYAQQISPNVKLQWQGNFIRNATYDVFLGTHPDSLQYKGAALMESDSLFSFYPILSSYKTYFWKIRGITTTDVLWSGLWQFETGELLAADFTASDSLVYIQQEVQFTDLSTSNATSWEWDFDNDGTIDSSDQNPIWVYDTPDTYDVSLTVHDNINTHEILKEEFIKVIPFAPPRNLAAEVMDYDVELTWQDPTWGDEWLHYDDGINDSSIGASSGDMIDFDVAVRYEPDQIVGFDGMFLTQVRFFPRSYDCEYSVRVWQGANAINLLVDQVVTNPVIDQWNTVDLNTPVQIDASQELWFGYRNNCQSGYPAGCDAGPAIAYYGDMIYWNGEWQSLSVDHSLDYNWNIQGWVSPNAKGEIASIPLAKPVRSLSSGLLEIGNLPKSQFAEVTTENKERDFVSYNIYRNGNLLADNIVVENYLDESLQDGIYNYYVTAVYDEGESGASNEVEANVPTFVPKPDINLTQQSIEFGESAINNESSEILTIENLGDAELAITNVYTDTGFFWVNDTNFVIPAGDFYELEVIFAPNETEFYTGTLTIESNDPDESEVSLSLSGLGIEAPFIEFSKNQIVANAFADQVVIEEFVIYNVGSANLNYTLDALERRSDIISINTERESSDRNSSYSDYLRNGLNQKNRAVDWMTLLPLAGTVVPGDSALITVTLDATGLVNDIYSADIAVESNDLHNPLTSVGVNFAIEQKNFTTLDNENNQFEGLPDYDLDYYLFNDDPLHPIEFNIFVDTSNVTTAQLNVYGYDIDETSGEINHVYLNGTFLGAMTGASNQWSTSVFSVDPTILNYDRQGKNLVQIYVDVENVSSWATEIDWAQLIINEQNIHAFIRDVNFDFPVYGPNMNVGITEEIDTDLASHQVRVETNLLNQDNVNVDGISRTITISYDNDEPFTENLTVPANATSGIYTVQVIVYDAINNYQEDIGTYEIEIDENATPNHPPVVVEPLGTLEISQNLADSTSLNLFDHFEDPDEDNLHFTCSGNQHVAVEIGAEGEVTFFPEYGWTGQEEIVFSADDTELKRNSKIKNRAAISDTLMLVVVPLPGTVVDAGDVSGTWNIDSSPYHVMGDIEIPAGSSLNVLALSEDNPILVYFYYNSSFTINGRLQADGVNFTGYENELWGGITMNAADMESTIRNCDIEDAIAPLIINGASPIIENVTIHHNQRDISGKAIVINGASNINMDGVHIHEYNDVAIDIQNDTELESLPTLTNIRVQNSSSSTRTENIGINIGGSIVANVNDVELENYGVGLNYDSNGGEYSGLPTLSNIRVQNSSSSTRVNRIGIKCRNLVQFRAENSLLKECSTGFSISNTTDLQGLPTLSNIRVQNSSSSTRNDEIGIVVTGNNSAQFDDIQIENVLVGIDYDSDGTRYRDLPTLSNIRVQNSSSSTRSNSIGIQLRNVGNFTTENDSLTNCGIGIAITDTTGLASLPTLTNIRVQNSSSSTRSNEIGIHISGKISATISDVDIENVELGIDYHSDGEPTRDLPTLSNIRVQNSSSSTRSNMIGIKLENVPNFIAENDTISNCTVGISASNSSAYSSLPTLSNIRVQNSSSSTRSGLKGIELMGDFSDVEFTGNEIANCDSAFVLQGVSSATLNDNTVYYTARSRDNSVGLFAEGSDLTFTGNTFYHFDHAISVDAGTINMDHNILWDENPNPDIIVTPNSTVNSDCNTIYLPGGAEYSPSDHNINPRFLDTDVDEIDLHLQNGPILAYDIGSLGFPDYEYSPEEPLEPDWNLVGNPVTLQWGFTDPIEVFADDLTPFFVYPYNSSIYTLDSATLSYVVPDTLALGHGFWLNANDGGLVDAIGYISEESLEIELSGDAGVNNGWHLVANPYDVPVLFDDIQFNGDVMQGGYIYQAETNAYQLLISGDYLPAWSGIFMKGNAADASITFHYPVAATRNSSDRPEEWFVQLNAAGDNTQSIVLAGASENAIDGYDNEDMMALPSLPFLPNLNTINLESVHMDWDNHAGYYQRDMRELNHENWLYELELRTSETTTISLQDWENVPAEYDVMLTNLITTETVNLRETEMTIEVNRENERDRDLQIVQLELRIGSNLTEGEEDSVPVYEFGLKANYPNPFNPTTTIIYSLPETCEATLEIYNVKGQKVRTLATGLQERGYHQVVWDGSDDQNRIVSSGLYFYKLKSKEKIITRKMLMIK